jgi:DinB superfamily
MSEISSLITNGFIHRYREFAGMVHTLANELTEEDFWTRPYPYGNSVGHLTLHIIGNLNYYIGAEIAGTGYVRERDREFTESEHQPKAEVLRQLDAVVELVVKTLQAQTTDSWGAYYSTPGMENVTERFSTFLRCLAHFQHHIGQMIYLTFEHKNRMEGDDK